MRIVIPGAVLRDWTPGDTESLARNADNPRIAAMMRDLFPSPYTRDDAARFIAMATGKAGILFLAIEIGGEAAGGIGIHLLEDVRKKTAEIGYWLGEPYWGKHIMTHAVRALVPVAFSHFEIVRLQAGIFGNNPASMRVLENAGFVREAVHRDAIMKNGMIMDEVMYVFLKGQKKGVGIIPG